MERLKIFLLLPIFILSCKNQRINNIQNKSKVKKEIKSVERVNNKPKWDFNLDTLQLKDVLFNKKAMFFSLEKMEKIKIDSIKYKLWECGHPFEWMDKNYPADSLRSIFIRDSEYITNENKVLLYSSKMKNNILSLSNGKQLTEKTTIEEFSQIFPISYTQYSKSKEHNSENYKEVNYIRIAFSKKQLEDHWIFYFKNGKLYSFRLYWMLC